MDEEKSSNSGDETSVAGKKKIGRPFCSKNTKNFTMEKKEVEGGVTMQVGNMQPSPNSKGKDVL